MIKNLKVYKVLRHFSKTELNRLAKFVQSPYFNANNHLVVFHDIISALVYKNEERTRVSIWTDVKGGERYSDSKFRKLCTDYLALVETFLAVEAFQSDMLMPVYYLSEQIASNRLSPLYKTTRRLANKQLDKTPAKSSNEYLMKYNLQKTFNRIDNFELKRNVAFDFQEVSYNLDCFYIIEKLKLQSQLLSQRSIVQDLSDLPHFDKVLSMTYSNPYSENINISVFKTIASLYEDPYNESIYDDLKQSIFGHIERFPDVEARDIFYAAVNFCIRQINRGKRETYLREVFELYQFALSKTFFYDRGELTPWTFMNIVLAALRLKEYDWCSDFINKYQQYLNEDIRENAVIFSTARLKWYEQKYDDVISLLQFVEFDDYSYALGSKGILLATYYETDEIEALYSLMDSFRVFLNRNKSKIPAQTRKNYLNLIKYLKKLTKIRPGEKEQIKALREEIEGQRDISDRSWLLKKVEELAV